MTPSADHEAGGETGAGAEVADRVETLRAEIAAHNRRYHTDDAPTISDADYDDLVRELRSLEEQFPELVVESTPTASVGAAPSATFAPVVHRQPMTSLDNAFSQDELRRLGRAHRPAARSRPVRFGAPSPPTATRRRPPMATTGPRRNRSATCAS